MNNENLTGRDKIAGLLFEDIMQSISKDTIAWKQYVSLRWAIDTFNAECPNCDQLKGIKTNSDPVHDQSCKTISQSAKCTFCSQHFKVFVIDPFPLVDEDLNKDPTCESVWAYPTANVPRKLIFDENSINNTRIFKAYKSAVNAFNNKDWDVVLAMCGKTLEGICKKHFPRVKDGDTLGDLFGKLNKSLKTDVQYLPLLEPMQSLGKALSLGRNVAAHFNVELDPNKSVASKVLDSTEFVIKYFYTLNDDSKELYQQILDLEPENIEDIKKSSDDDLKLPLSLGFKH